MVSRVEDKKFVGKNIVYAGLWKKNDRHMIYNVVYLNKDDNKTYIKRFSIESILKDKEYPISKKADSAKILYITGNPNSESEIIKINLHFKCKAKKKEFEYDFDEVMIKSRLSKGNILTKYPVRKITQSQLGKSTFGGKKIWFEESIGKLNFDGRGNILGRFEADDKILVIYKSGEYEISSIDLSKRFNFSNIDILSKFNSDDSISCVHYIGNKKSYYIKRFKIETNQSDKLFSFIDPSRGSKLIKSTNVPLPILKFNYRSKNGEKKQKVINIDEFIDIKGWKASGNKMPPYLRVSAFNFEANPNIHLEEKADINEVSKNEAKSDNDEIEPDELTLF